MKLGRQRKSHKGHVSIRHYANLREPLFNLRFKLYSIPAARGGGGGPLVLADCVPAWPADPGTGGSAGKLRAHSAVPGSPPT